MATGATTESGVDATNNDYDSFIIQQVERTQRQVKVTELATLLLMLAVGSLAFFLCVTIVDHWILGLGIWGRMLSLLVFVAGSSLFIAVKVLPYVLRSINPIYAAHAIEKSTPSVKNGLINFMLLRDRPQEVRSAVFDAVQKRAAVDLSSVEVDLAVDRTLMIRLGYAFAILVTIAGAYKIVSPKDPLTTVARVITPWENIARPSRVQIENVTPGDATVYRGDSIEISASVLGVDSDDTVSVVYSTEDGQVVNSKLSMTLDSGSSYTAVLGSSGGMQQPTLYRIQGGDAESIEYRIAVKEAPSIDVTRVDYDFARHTELSPESTNVGDIRAVEGTKVTISAESNQPIASAYLELMPGSLPDDDAGPSTQLRTVRMQHSGKSATATFVLKLMADRQTAEYSSYRVRFSNEEGLRNDRPVLHQIEVTPDLIPVIDILSPTKRDIEVPANRSVDFEVRGVDPDFKLKGLTIEAATGGTGILKKNLLEQDESGQVVRKYRLKPESLALKPGMSVLVWAVASDNRHSPKTGQPDPNSARTENYRLRIVAPDRFEPDPADEEKQPDKNSQPDQNQQSDEGGKGDQGDNGGVGGTKSNDSADGTSSESENDDHSGSGSESDSDQSSDPSDSSAEGAGDDSKSNSDPSSNGTESDSSQSRDDSASNESTGTDSADPNGTPSQDGTGQSGEGTKDEPVASDGTNDPDAFERILDHMRENGETPDSASPEDQQSDSADAESSESNSNPNDGSDSGQETESSDSGGDEQPREASPGDTSNSESSNDNESGGKPKQDGSDGSPEPSPANGGDQELRDNQTGDSDNATGDSPNDRKDPSDSKTNDGTGNPKNNTGNSADEQTTDPEDGDTNSKQPSSNSGDRDGESGSDATKGDADESNNAKGKNDGDDGKGESATGKQDATNSSDPQNKANSNDPAGTGDPADAPETRDPSDAADPNGQPSGDSPDGDGTASDGTTESDEGAKSQQPTGGNTESTTGDNGKASRVEDQDDPNLEYARKATDMAIEYLKDKKNDPKLLDELGWTEAEAEAFLKRWQKLQKEATTPGKSKRTKREWNDSLKSLGLKPKSKTTTTSGATRKRDDRSISTDSGGRTKPPKAYADQFRAYLKESDSNQ